MTRPLINTRPWTLVAAGVLFAAAAAMVVPEYSAAQEKEGTEEQPAAHPPKPADQTAYPTPQGAAAALFAACEADDTAALMKVLGAKHKDVYVSADPHADKEDRKNFAASAKQRLRLENLDETTVEMIIGREGWPSPLLIVKVAEGWYIDTEEGAEEILNRRIGGNELDTMETCRAYINAQITYASKDRDGDRVLEYAQKLKSSPGKKDGLYWPVAAGADEEQSPMGPMVAESPELLDEDRKGTAWQGYFYKPLTKQGAKAPGGAHDYVINGNQIAGVAALAYPAEYGQTGIMTFMVSHHGDLLEKDLGKDTAAIVAKMTEYDPDETWKPVEEE